MLNNRNNLLMNTMVTPALNAINQARTNNMVSTPSNSAVIRQQQANMARASDSFAIAQTEMAIQQMKNVANQKQLEVNLEAANALSKAKDKITF